MLKPCIGFPMCYIYIGKETTLNNYNSASNICMSVNDILLDR